VLSIRMPMNVSPCILSVILFNFVPPFLPAIGWRDVDVGRFSLDVHKNRSLCLKRLIQSVFQFRTRFGPLRCQTEPLYRQSRISGLKSTEKYLPRLLIFCSALIHPEEALLKWMITAGIPRHSEHIFDTICLQHFDQQLSSVYCCFFPVAFATVRPKPMSYQFFQSVNEMQTG
jgi:hypothetical protein